jgi:hypothetical protein
MSEGMHIEDVEASNWYVGMISKWVLRNTAYVDWIELETGGKWACKWVCYFASDR